MKIDKNQPISLRRLLHISLTAATLLLAGCGGGTTAEPDVTDGRARVSNTGGTVSITSPSSPIKGASVSIGTETLPGDNESITINYQDALPAPLSADALALGAKQISKVLVLTRTGTADFGTPVTVTVPYDKAQLSANAVPIVVFWDELNNTYSPVMVSSIDRTNGMLSFLTSHFSKYVVLVLDKLAGVTRPDPATLSSDVGFSPAADGFYIHNFGSYDSPGGNCFGMAAYSAWYHKSKKSVKGAGLYSLYREGDPALEEDDQAVRELVTRAFQLGDQRAHKLALNKVSAMGFERNLEDWTTGVSIISQLAVTKQAQIFAMGIKDSNAASGWTAGHAVTVYAYDGAKKVFKLYDNNFPNEVLELSWDPVSGFGQMPKNYSFDRFAFAAFNTAYSPATLENLFNEAEGGWSLDKFPKIAISSPVESLSNKNTFEVASDVNVSITGTVPRAPKAENPTAQRYVHVYLNGTQFGKAVTVGNTSNAFTIPIANLPAATGTDVILLVSESPDKWKGAFTAFKQFKLRVANKFFFKNFGFETGNFDNWYSERHIWSGGSSVIPSDKSSIVAKGAFDPIATDLPTTLFGKKAAIINNADDSFHISSLSQTAVVPTAKNPVVRFSWAAVLEDPQHSADEQPYVDVTVHNQTKGVDLYHKRFYTNDPQYSGWKPYQNGQWKSIPWQLVELPVAAYVGDTLVLKVEAADCAQGGHGGYAYLDAEE